PSNTGQIILSAILEWSKVPCGGNLAREQILISLSWEFPSIGVVKLNGQILEAELWGLFFGLKMALDKGINRLIIEMD
ncbi:unnamed protein product, partial [Prunus brigantina]